MSPAVILLPGEALADPPPWWRRLADVAAAAVMPWRAAARIRSQDRCLDFMVRAVIAQQPPEAGSAPAAPVLRLIRGGLDGR